MAKKNPFHFVRTVFDHSDRLTRFDIVLLGIVSLVCASTNVAVPLLQKTILERLDQSVDTMLWVYLLVAGIGCLFLLFENMLNINILTRLRKELEFAMEESLAIRDQPLLQEKGVGVFAGAITGDSEQLARVLAANWFSIAFNLVGAVVSIIISAQWKLYFLVIVLIAYVLILLIIFFCTRASVHYFRLEKDVSYTLNAKIREMVDTHRAIMAYGSFLDYRKTFEAEINQRLRYGRRAERMSSLADALIKLIRVLSITAFFFCAVRELRSLPTSEERLALFPVIIALVSYFETIFLPVGALNLTYGNASKFRAFFEPYRSVTEHDTVGEFPINTDLMIHHVSNIRDGMVILSSLTMNVDCVYGVFGLEGEAKAIMLSYLRGESYPIVGHIELGGARIFEIEKSLRLSLLMFNSAPNEIFGQGLEFNMTMGKRLVGDQEYETLWKEYRGKLTAFFKAVKAGDLFTNRHHKALRAEILGDFFSIDNRMTRQKSIRVTILERFREVKDTKAFIASVGRAIFAKKYAKRSRYEAIVRGLELEDLTLRSFGVTGQYLTQSEKALVLLARFLLPETDAPFILIDPMEHVPLEQVKRCVKFIKETIEGRKGLIFTQDLELFRSLTDQVLLFEDGRLVECAPHAKLVRKSKDYAKLCKEKGLIKSPVNK